MWMWVCSSLPLFRARATVSDTTLEYDASSVSPPLAPPMMYRSLLRAVGRDRSDGGFVRSGETIVGLGSCSMASAVSGVKVSGLSFRPSDLAGTERDRTQ
jgi:hypothetical protein